MSPRRNARRLEQALPPDPAPAIHPLRVVARPAAPVSSTSSVPTATPRERPSTGSLAQVVMQLAGGVASGAKRAVQVAKPVARQAWTWLCTEAGARLGQSKTRRLRLAETLSLGEKRFVCLVEIDGQAFLIGGSSNGVSLLAECQGKRDKASFGSVMEQAHWPEKEST